MSSNPDISTSIEFGMSAGRADTVTVSIITFRLPPATLTPGASPINSK